MTRKKKKRKRWKEYPSYRCNYTGLWREPFPERITSIAGRPRERDLQQHGFVSCFSFSSYFFGVLHERGGQEEAISVGSTAMRRRWERIHHSHGFLNGRRRLVRDRNPVGTQKTSLLLLLFVLPRRVSFPPPPGGFRRHTRTSLRPAPRRPAGGRGCRHPGTKSHFQRNNGKVERQIKETTTKKGEKTNPKQLVR